MARLINFTFYKLRKRGKRGQPPPTVPYQAYTQDPIICVVKRLDEYISRIEGSRSEEEFLSFYQILLIHIKQ